MSFKKIVFILFCGMVVFSFLLSCAGPKEAVKEEKPAEKKEEVAKAVEPEPKVEMKPMEWTTAVKDAEVEMGGKAVRIPKEYSKYSLKLRSLERNKFELYLEERGAAPVLLLEGTSTLKSDREGRIAFRITDIDEESVQPIFDVLGLRVLKKDELRDNYYLFGTLKERGVSTLEAYDMGGSVIMEFSPN
jgi:hypothetical protein